MHTREIRERRLFEQVAALSDFMGYSKEIREEGRAQARAAAQRKFPSHMADIRVSLRREIQFPKREVYGEALNSLVSVIASRERVHNALGPATRSVLEADLPRDLPQGRFLFFPVRKAEVDRPIRSLTTTYSDGEFSLRLWDYLCFAVVEPRIFRRRPVVVVGEKTYRNSPEELRHAPSLFFDRERLRLSSVSVDVTPTPPLAHLIGGRFE